jgi:hypothetical protein
MNIGELLRLYQSAESCDQELAAEQRSNIRLTMGLHYQRRTSAFWKSLREAENISKQQRLRLTKNHIHRIVRYWTNAILSRCPDALILPANESEIQDQKSAELNRSVWHHKKKELEINGTMIARVFDRPVFKLFAEKFGI